MKLRTLGAAVAATTATLVLFTACGSSPQPPAPPPPTSPAVESPAPAPSPSETPSASPSASAQTGGLPAWAATNTVVGDKLTTIKIGTTGVTVDVYQVGTTKATKDGMFVNPDNNQPIIKKGDTLVFVNYVFTNTGAEPVPMASLLVDMRARYADWPWLQGMSGEATTALYNEMGVVSFAIKSNSGVNPPYILAPGESYAWAENFGYEKGGSITFTASLTPAKADGSLDFDKRQTGEATATTP